MSCECSEYEMSDGTYAQTSFVSGEADIPATMTLEYLPPKAPVQHPACPSCGYCPTCGRRNGWYPVYPPYMPYQPYYWWSSVTSEANEPAWIVGDTKITSVTYTN